MLHLFNSCYVQPFILFDPTNNHLVVGEEYINRPIINNSFYYTNSFPKDAFDRLDSFETFASSNWLEPVLHNKDKIIIYTDNDNFIKFFTAKLKTQVKNLSKEFFLTSAKLFAVKLKTRAKLLATDDAKEILNSLAEQFLALDDIPAVDKFNLTEDWVTKNAGIEWQFANGIYNNLNDIIDRNIYSYFGEAKANYLSRKEPAGSWATNPNNQQYRTVNSIADLYMEMRKDICIFTDSLILDYFSDNIKMFKDPKVLLLIASNKDMGDKIDIWLMRWFMKMSQEQIKELGILA
jgi:hypothetical protein